MDDGLDGRAEDQPDRDEQWQELWREHLDALGPGGLGDVSRRWQDMLQGVNGIDFSPIRNLSVLPPIKPHFISPTIKPNIVVPKIRTNIDLPRFDTQAMFASTIKSNPSFLAWTSTVAEAMRSIAPILEYTRNALPGNLLDMGGDFDGVIALISEEHIPVYGAPRADIVDELVAASGTAGRYEVLQRRAADICVDCRALVESCTSGWSADVAPFSLEVVDALEANLDAAAQALAASIVDTLVTERFGSDAKHYKPSVKGNPQVDEERVDNLESLNLRDYLTFRPIWGAFQHFTAGSGQGVPATFSRHASAHAVSREQYTAANAVIAMLFACTITYSLDRRHHLAEDQAA